jgi:hypothetical protein
MATDHKDPKVTRLQRNVVIKSLHTHSRPTANLRLHPRQIATLVQIRATRTLHIHILHIDIKAHARRRTDKIPNKWIVLLARRALEVLDVDIADSQITWKLIAQREVLLPVTLRDFNRIVDIGQHHAIVGDVLHGAASAASLQITAERSGRAGPDFDAGAVGRVAHGDVVYVDILYIVDFAFVLAKRTDGDAVAAVTLQVLDDDVGAVGLEGDAVVAVVDV